MQAHAQVPGNLAEDLELRIGKVAVLLGAEQRNRAERRGLVRQCGRAAIINSQGLHPFQVDGRAIAALDIHQVQIAIYIDHPRVKAPNGVVIRGVAFVIIIKRLCGHSVCDGANKLRLSVSPRLGDIEHRDTVRNHVCDAFE